MALPSDLLSAFLSSSSVKLLLYCLLLLSLNIIFSLSWHRYAFLLLSAVLLHSGSRPLAFLLYPLVLWLACPLNTFVLCRFCLPLSALNFAVGLLHCPFCFLFSLIELQYRGCTFCTCVMLFSFFLCIQLPIFSTKVHF